MKTSSATISPFDDFQILDSERHIVPITRIVPAGYEKYIIPGSTVYSATGQPGIFLFQEIAFPQYSFWVSHYFSRSRKKVIGLLPQPSLELHFILLGDVLYRLKDFDWQSLKETQYNLLSIPQIENEVYFEAKDYITFDIHPTLPFLKKIMSNDHRLKEFLNKVKKGSFEQFFTEHQFTTPKMLYLIKEILEHLGKNEMISPGLDSAVQQLFEFALTNIKGHLKPIVNFFDVEKLYLAEKSMINHMDDIKILEKQIHRSHIYKVKFREGFRQIFGELPHTYLHRKRMEKAKYLLEHYSDFKIKDIAERVGYFNSNYFSTAYKNFFGISPRRNTKNDHS